MPSTVGNELIDLQHAVSDLQRKVRRLEGALDAADYADLNNSLKKVNEVLHGKERDGGLIDTVVRLTLLVDGDERYNVIGLRKRIEAVEIEMSKLVSQRNMIKWALVGMGVAGVSNAGALITVLAKVLGGP